MTSEMVQLTPELQRQRQLIRDTFANGASDHDFEVLMAIAEARNLNPFTRQVYFVERWDREKNRKVWSVQVSIDGLRALAERSGLYAGQDEPEYTFDDKGQVICCKVKIYRKDWKVPCTGVAYFKEFVQLTKEGRPTSFWQRMPLLMISKCSEALGLRKAFPEVASGLYTPEEMGNGAVVQGEIIQDEEQKLETKRANSTQKEQEKSLEEPANNNPLSASSFPTKEQVANDFQKQMEHKIGGDENDSRTKKLDTPEKTIAEIATDKAKELREQLNGLHQPSLFRLVQMWIDGEYGKLGDSSVAMFSMLLGRLPKLTPKAWLIKGVEHQTILLGQEIAPENPGDSYVPNERARFGAYADAISQSSNVEAVANVWKSRKEGASKEIMPYWWHCACVEVARREGIDAVNAEKKLKEAVLGAGPSTPTDTKKRQRKPPVVSTPASGQGHETTQQVGTTGHMEDLSLASWETHLERKQTPHIIELENSLARRLRVWTPEEQAQGIAVFEEYLKEVHKANPSKVFAMVKTAKDKAARPQVRDIQQGQAA